MTSEMKELYGKRKSQAIAGSAYWEQLQADYLREKGCYLFLVPEYNVQYLQSVKNLILPFLESKNGTRGTVLYVGEYWEDAFLEDAKVQYVKITREQAKEIMTLSCLQELPHEVVIVSLTEPEGRKGIQFLEDKNFTWEEVLQKIVFQ